MTETMLGRPGVNVLCLRKRKEGQTVRCVRREGRERTWTLSIIANESMNNLTEGTEQHTDKNGQ